MHRYSRLLYFTIILCPPLQFALYVWDNVANVSVGVQCLILTMKIFSVF